MIFSEFIVEMTKALAWPIVVAWVLNENKESIKGLFFRVKQGKIGPSGLDIFFSELITLENNNVITDTQYNEFKSRIIKMQKDLQDTISKYHKFKTGRITHPNMPSTSFIMENWFNFYNGQENEKSIVKHLVVCFSLLSEYLLLDRKRLSEEIITTTEDHVTELIKSTNDFINNNK